MTLHLGYRAELANQVLGRLLRFDEAAWQQAGAALAARGEYFELAYALAHDAVALLAEEHGSELEAVLRSRLADVDARYPEPEPASLPRRRLARAAVLAAFLRDSRGFNLGAFEELFAPVAGSIDIRELERTARAAVGTDTTDFQVKPARYEPPSLSPGRRRA